MPFSRFEPSEVLTFFAVLVRYSVLIAVLPIFGDRMIPTPVKILLSVAISMALFPALTSQGFVRVSDAAVWGNTASGIVGTIALETLFALALGFTAKLVFESVNVGANIAGGFMGFASASLYDPHQESQTQVVAEIQITLSMLMFLAVDGHHAMLSAALGSYKVVGLGKAGLGVLMSQKFTELSGQVLRFGIQIAAPVALSMFAVNLAFGVVSKAMPQLNVLVLSFAATALVGLTVMLVSLPEFMAVAGEITGRVSDEMNAMIAALRTS